MNDIIQGAVGKLPVYLSDSSGVPVEGVVFGDVTMWTRKVDSALVPFVLTADNWTEIGSGHYEATTATSETDTLGALHYHCSATGVTDYPGVATIVAASTATAYSISGVVTDSNGDPIEGAEVYVSASDTMASPRQAVSDGNGNYLVYLPSAGTYYVQSSDVGKVLSDIAEVVVA